MKKYVLSVLLLLLSAMLFSCGTEPEAPRGILERMVRAGNDLPAGTVYDRRAEKWEDGYMDPAILAELYDLRGYSELSHIEDCALYLSGRYDAPFEIGVFLCYDEAVAEDVREMCLYRMDFLTRHGAIKEENAAVMTSGRYVIYVAGAEPATAKKLLSAAR